MNYLIQSELIRQVEIFITNGIRPEAQIAIAGVGYDLPALNNAQVLIEAIKTEWAQTKELLAAQKNATNIEKSARQAAQKEIASLSSTARLLFADDGAALTALGLQTQYRTVTQPETGNNIRQAVSLSKATAETIGRWRQLITNVAALNEAQRAQLTAAGWGTARVAAAGSLVEAFAAADTAQQSAIQSYRQAKTQYRADVEALRRWYGRARGLTLLAIKDNDPANQQYLRDMLGLNG